MPDGSCGFVAPGALGKLDAQLGPHAIHAWPERYPPQSRARFHRKALAVAGLRGRYRPLATDGTLHEEMATMADRLRLMALELAAELESPARPADPEPEPEPEPQ